MDGEPTVRRAYLSHIEPAVDVFKAVLDQVVLSRGGELLLFGLSYGLGGGAVVGCSLAPDFDEHQRVAVASDQVYFT